MTSWDSPFAASAQSGEVNIGRRQRKTAALAVCCRKKACLLQFCAHVRALACVVVVVGGGGWWWVVVVVVVVAVLLTW